MLSITHGRIQAGRIIWMLVGLLVIVAIAVLTSNVLREVRAQALGQSDNLEWSLAQTDVEFQQLLLPVTLGEDAAEISRRFDIFYSRINTLRQAPVFDDLRETPRFSQHLAKVSAYLDQGVMIIDGGSLLDDAPQLLVLTRAISSDVRALTNAGLRLFVERADRQRAAVARTMLELAFVVAALILALVVGLVSLVRLNLRISERERAQLRTLTRLNTIMSTSLDGVILSDADGRITGFNNAAERIFGYQVADVLGRSLGEVIVPDHLVAAHEAGMVRMRKTGEQRIVGSGRVQMDAKRADGAVFPVEMAVQSAMTDEGQLFIAFLRDVSQRVANEAELIAARDKAISGERSRAEFLATMSHEIRTPLNGLLGNLSLLRDTDLGADQDRLMRNMDTSGRLLMSHVSDVLDIARYDSGGISARLEPMNISDLVQDIVDNQSSMATAAGTTLTWQWDGAPQDWIVSDRDRLQHVLMNLVGNAVKFTQAGRVSVTVSWQPEGEIQFLVEDTGIGIDDSLKARMFDDFVTGNTAYDRHVGGTGLGLSIVRRIVATLGGDIDVEGALGVGCTFQVVVPVAAADPRHDGVAVVETVAPLDVLVVEDNEINRFVVCHMLMQDGHHVVEAIDGQSGVAKAHDTAFDLILMDIAMPLLDGRSATRQIRDGGGASQGARICALTANALASEQADFLAHGMDGVLTKPLTRDALRRVLAGGAAPVAPVEPVPLALIDLAHNAETRALVGAKSYADLRARFIKEIDGLAVALAADDPDPEQIATRAHRASGTAAIFGAVALSDAVLQVQTAAEARASLSPQIADFDAVWQATQLALTSGSGV